MDQKLGYARICAVELECQEGCAQDLRAACPSMWRQISPNVCEAPQQYIGHCSRRVSTAGMTNNDKQTWGSRCGARWPCFPPKKHIYDEICPKGWSLGFGQVCTAPRDYEGPCQR